MPGGGNHSFFKLYKGGKKTAKGVLTTVLNIAEFAVKGCPVWGPEAAVSIVLTILRGIDQTKQNVEALNDLKLHVQRLITVVLTPILNVEWSNVPDGLRADIDRLNSDLAHLVMEWGGLSSQSSVRRFFNRDKDSSQIVSLGKKLENAVAEFGISGTIHIQLAIKAQQQELAEAKIKDAQLQLAQQEAAVDAKARDDTNREETILREQSRLLDRLPRAKMASYDSGRSDTRSSCFEGTRTAILEKIEAWFTDTSNHAPRLFWLNGLAGIGKSTIAQTVANRAHARGILGASFFFSRQDAKLNTPGLVFPELAFQFAQFDPVLKTHITEALDTDPDLGTKALALQVDKLIINPLIRANSPRGAVIVFDALDECESFGAGRILQLLLAHIGRVPFPIFIFITSRPEPHIRYILDEGASAKVVLHDIEQSIVQGDINLYIRSHLTNIPRLLPELQLKSCWAKEHNIQALVANSGRLFIYAATALRFIADSVIRNPSRQLDMLLDTNSDFRSDAHSELDELYIQVLRLAIGGGRSSPYALDRFQKVVGTIVLLRDPLPIMALADIIGLRQEDIMSALANLHSIILIPTTPDHTPSIYHPSFPDFITTASRCKDRTLLIVPQDHHHRLALRCFVSIMSLERDMLGIADPSLLNSEIPDFDARIRNTFSSELQYACRYWASHLVQVESNKNEILEAMKDFLSQSLLIWLEAMSLLGSMSGALESIENVKDWATKQGNSGELSALLSDTHRFILEHFDVIKACALHTSYSALPFTPRSNQIYELYHGETWDTIQVLQGLNLEWSPHMTLGGHSSLVNSVAFSYDGTKMASGSHDGTIRIWDPTSGAHLATLEGHSDPVNSVAFSYNEAKLASGSHDSTIRIWDSASGAHLITLEGHSETVNSVAFSCDGTKLASGSHDKTVRIWDPKSGTHLATLEGHSQSVNSVAFSRDGTSLASGSDDNTIRKWDPISGAHCATLEGHSGWVTSVAFSCDGTKLASGSDDNTVRIWDPISNVHLATLEGHSQFITSVAFSRDSTKIASGSYDNAIRIWDSTSGAHLVTLEGHPSSVTSVAFSHNGAKLASSSWDETIRIWDPTSDSHFTTFEGHTQSVSSVAFSRDGKKIASGSYDNTIRIWDPMSGTHLVTLEGHSDTVNSISFSYDGTKVASGSHDKTIRLWDPTSGAHLITLEGHPSPVNSVTFSHNEKLATGSNDNTIRIWDSASGIHLATLEGHPQPIKTIAFSSNGTKLTAYSRFPESQTTWDIPNAMVDPRRAIYPSSSLAQVVPSNDSIGQLSYMLGDHWLLVRQSGGEWRRVCHIPPEYGYNEEAFVWCGRCVTIGCRDGRILILDLSHVNI